MSYKNYNWEVVAGDYSSPYLRNWLWTHSFFKYPKLLGISRLVMGIASRNYKIEYLADLSIWLKVHEELKVLVSKDFKNFENLINKSIDWGETLIAWTEANIFANDLTKLSDAELISLFKEFIDKQEDEYAYGTVLPVLDFQSFSFVEGNLNRILTEKVPAEKFQDYYSAFTEPEDNSFAQDQEEALLRLMDVYYDKADWQNEVKEKSLAEVKNKFPDFYADLVQHTKEYAWAYYVYMGPLFTEQDFYGFIVDHFNKGIVPQQKLKDLQAKRARIIKAKEEYLQVLQLTGLDEFILKIASRVVWAKPRRKDYQSKAYYHVEKLCQEIAGRLAVSLEHVRSAPMEILEQAIAGQEVDWSIVDSIKNFHICLPNDDGTIATLVGEEAEEFSQHHIKRSDSEPDFSLIKELKGSTACLGKVTGKAKIINLPEDMEKMEQGDILVSAATTPSIVPAMKKAGAIVTDEGGLTCHAAIVSRELNIPCVVGLKVVTKFVKDGEQLEVDATKVIVRKLN